MRRTFSVIIPVFNREVKVGRSIRSVKNAAKSVEDAVEIVVIDDASTDCSYDAACSSGADVVLRLSQNLGVTAARNHGIKCAKGDFVIILDSDDELVSNALAKIGSHFDSHPTTDILFGSCVDRSGRPMHDTDAKMGAASYRDLLVHGARGEFMPVARRAVFDILSFEGALRGFEGITWLKAARMGFKLYYSDEMLRIYDKQGDDRLCRRENIMRGADRLAVGWACFLEEFGNDLWRWDKCAFANVALKKAVYEKLCIPKRKGAELTMREMALVPRHIVKGLHGLCACVPRLLVSYIMGAR